jgi:DNA-binding transcriptional regulator YdaS (Cro superfamily)
MLMRMKKSPLERAVEAAGSKSALARALGLKVQSIQQWRRIPAERVLDVERATGVPRSALRPDLYPEGREQRHAA